jgi:hypothetical protein
MKKLILILFGVILLGIAATTVVRADCDTPDPGDPTSFE